MLTLNDRAVAMVRDKTSIVAADESPTTMKERFEKAGIPYSEDAAHHFRTALFTTPGLENHVSAVILHEGTLNRTIEGMPTAFYLLSRGIIPGVKVDLGLRTLFAGSPERLTSGLDTLTHVALESFLDRGALFTKARSVYKIDVKAGLPSSQSVWGNAHFQALYAFLCQKAGLVPIVEPEVLIDGDHSIDDCYTATKHALTVLVNTLTYYEVVPGEMVLKPNMVTKGKDSTRTDVCDNVAWQTLKAISESGLSHDVPGIAFLSGGHNAFHAREYLAHINRRRWGKAYLYPWKLTASFGRGSQETALKTYAQFDGDIEKTQRSFMWTLERIAKARAGLIHD